MDTGIQSPNLPRATTSESLLVNSPAGTSRQTVQDFAMQLVASEPMRLATMIGNLYDTEADLPATTAQVTPWVINDPDPDKIGIYKVSSGAWVKALPLPYGVLQAEVDDGDAVNARRLVTTLPVYNGVAVIIPVVSDNTISPVTASFDGGETWRTIKTSAGADVPEGGLTAGMKLIGIVQDTTIHLVSDASYDAVMQARLIATNEARLEALDAKTDSLLAKEEALEARSVALLAADAASSSLANAAAAAEASGDVVFFDNKADAEAAKSGLPANQVVRIFCDESNGNAQVFYRVEGGELIEKLNTDARFPPLVGAYSLLSFGVVLPGVDCRALILAALAALKARGGGVLLLPYIGGGGYVVSDKITIDFSNCIILLGDDIRLTKTSKSALFVFSGASRAEKISNVALVGYGRKSMVDGNGAYMSGYTYSLVDNLYSPILFRWCVNWRIENIWATNGLVNAIRGYQVGAGIDIDCDASNTIYDNGHSIEFDPTTWTSGDPTSAASSGIIRPRAWECRGYGVTAYAAARIQIDGARVWSCGNDGSDGATYNVVGGGISVEIDASDSSAHDLRATIIDPQVDDCYGAGISLTERLTQIFGGRISGMKRTSVKPDPIDGNGSGLRLLGRGEAETFGLKIEKSGGNGIVLVASGGLFPSLRFDGEVRESVRRAIYARGVASLEISPNSLIENNVDDGVSYPSTIYVSNSGGTNYNQNAGRFRASGAIRDNGGRSIQSEYVQQVDLHGLRLRDNAKTTSSASSQLRVSDAGFASAIDVISTDANSKTTEIVNFQSTVAIGIADSICGDATNAAVSNSATTRPTVQRQGVLRGAKTWAPGNQSAGARGTTTITVTGAALGDMVRVSSSIDLGGLTLFAYVSAANTVTVIYENRTASTINIGSNTLSAVVDR